MPSGITFVNSAYRSGPRRGCAAHPHRGGRNSPTSISTVSARNLKYPIVIDGRNLYDPEVMAAQGFTYYSVGRDAAHPDGVPSAVSRKSLKNGK